MPQELTGPSLAPKDPSLLVPGPLWLALLLLRNLEALGWAALLALGSQPVDIRAEFGSAGGRLSYTRLALLTWLVDLVGAALMHHRLHSSANSVPAAPFGARQSLSTAPLGLIPTRPTPSNLHHPRSRNSEAQSHHALDMPSSSFSTIIASNRISFTSASSHPPSYPS